MCSGGAPSPDPRIGEAALQNSQLAKDALAWYRDYSENKLFPLQQQQTALANRVADSQIAANEQQMGFARDQNQFYKDTFQPIERKVAADATGYDSQENIGRRQGIAAANVNQQFSNAAGQAARLKGRYGLVAGDTFKNLPTQQALATVGAQNGAAFDTMDKGIALRAGAANMGRNMPNTAAQFMGLGNQSNQLALAAGSAPISSALQVGQFAGQGFNTAMQGNQSAGNLYLGMYDAQMKGYAADQAASAALAQGIGTAAGMWAGRR